MRFDEIGSEYFKKKLSEGKTKYQSRKCLARRLSAQIIIQVHLPLVCIIDFYPKNLPFFLLNILQIVCNIFYQLLRLR